MQTAAPPADEVFEPAPVGSVALNYAEETPRMNINSLILL